MSRLGGRIARLPLRVRLVAGFSATMLLVLAAAGAFVYWRVQYALDRQLDGDLTSETRVLAPLVEPDGRLSPAAHRVGGVDLYQVLDPSGRVLSASPALGTTPMVSRATVAAALDTPVKRDIGALLPTTRDPLRALLTPLPADDRPQAGAVLLVAVRRDHRDEALLELLAQLAAAGAGALLVTALVGERLARLALRPVERYRSQASDIVAGATGVRLEVPPDRDDEVTRLGHTLNAMLERLEEALARERHFVDDASHELRTPLTLLTTRVQLARRRPRSVAEHEAVLAEIETDVVRLVRLADHLLEVGSGSGTTGECCDLAEVARHEVDRRNALARAHHEPGAPVAVDTATTQVPVALGAAAAEQLVGNLLDNAERHGGQPVEVHVDAADRWGRLAVVDHGPGMGVELLATATRRFTRSAESRSTRGFGLGLSLVEALVTRAGGRLLLCSGGHHASYGAADAPPAPACAHDAAMRVTVLLPLHREFTSGS